MFKAKWFLVLAAINLAISFIFSYLNLEFSNSKTLILSTFYLSLIFVSEAITLNLKNYSFLRVLVSNKFNLLSFVITSVIGGIILEMVA